MSVVKLQNIILHIRWCTVIKPSLLANVVPTFSHEWAPNKGHMQWIKCTFQGIQWSICKDFQSKYLWVLDKNHNHSHLAHNHSKFSSRTVFKDKRTSVATMFLSQIYEQRLMTASSLASVILNIYKLTSLELAASLL